MMKPTQTHGNETHTLSDTSPQEPLPASPKPNAPLPKRLMALMGFFTMMSISGLLAKQGVLFCLFTLLMVVAVLGRQRTALYLLRVYTLAQLAIVCLLPVLLYDPGNLIVGPTSVNLGMFTVSLPDWVIFSVLIALAILQVWVSFNAKVKAWFKPKINLNIMS